MSSPIKVVSEFLIIVVLIVSDLAGACWAATKSDLSAYKLGRSQAYRDLHAGKLQFKTYGLWTEQGARYEVILERNYGIKFIPVAGCEVTSKVESNARGYNEVMSAEIHRRYGQGILEQAAKQAHKEYLEELEFMRDPNLSLNAQPIPSGIIQPAQIPRPERLHHPE